MLLYKISGTIIIIFMVTSGMANAERSTVNELLSEYDNLWWQFDLNGAERVLDAILNENPRQPEALRNLAFVQYYYHQNHDRALESIQQAIDAEPLKAENHSVQGDVFFSKADFEQAVQSYTKAIELDNGNADYRLSLAKTLFKLNKHDEAKSALEKAVRLNPYLLEANNLLHMAYVEVGDYEKAYNIWKSGYLSDETGTSAYCPGDWNALYQTAILRNSQEPDFHRTMGQLYERLLLYDEAQVEYEQARQQAPDDDSMLHALGKISKFIHFREALKDTCIAFYRQQAVQGKMKEKNLLPRLIPIYTEIAGLFPDVRNPKKYNNDWLFKVNGKIEETFHVMIIYGYTDGFSDCHFGYVTMDTPREISQWGKTGKLRMVILKNMVTNGFSAWYWNYQAQNGGWTSSGGKAQANKFAVVLDPKYGAALHRWEMAADKLKRDKKIAEDIEKSKGLIDRPPLDVFYSSLIDRQLMLKALDEALLPTKDCSPEEQKAAFINMLFNHYCKTSTVIHEGQHALDAMNYHFKQWELEYRAKLSEIKYGEMPLLSLSDILNPDIGNMKLSHGRADTRIFADIAAYIRENKGKYPSINTDKNIMMQLDSLDSKAVKEIGEAIFKEKYR